ncbi:MAG: TlyA family rRNA (cytidine-2'-O)-methyltransferase [Anaerolineales bacterium]|nr:TlyA family rRNA (cytidine-2'-O)-methyltransferase [Anaerolineales bacterium]
MAERERIDTLMVRRSLAESRSAAQRLIMAGQVRADGQVVFKPAQRVESSAEITVDEGPLYVSRGGEKLEAAILAFEIMVQDSICADVGASTGGFTDCLLQHGAERVYAIDVGHGQLHWRLRNDPRIVLMERTNARHLESLQEPIDLVTIDVSFISLLLIFPAISQWLKSDGEVIALVKPQFEAGKEDVGKGGVVRDVDVHRQVLSDVVKGAEQSGLFIAGLVRSPLMGPKGNIEFLLWLVQHDVGVDTADTIESALSD